MSNDRAFFLHRPASRTRRGDARSTSLRAGSAHSESLPGKMLSERYSGSPEALLVLYPVPTASCHRRRLQRPNRSDFPVDDAKSGQGQSEKQASTATVRH